MIEAGNRVNYLEGLSPNSKAIRQVEGKKYVADECYNYMYMNCSDDILDAIVRESFPPGTI